MLLVTMVMLPMLLISCVTEREKLVYLYPIVMAPDVNDLEELPEYSFTTADRIFSAEELAFLPEEVVEKLKNYVLLSVQDATLLGKWIIDSQQISEELREKLLYYIRVTDWNKENPIE